MWYSPDIMVLRLSYVMLNTLIVDRMVFGINLKRSRGGNRKKSDINGLTLLVTAGVGGIWVTFMTSGKGEI